MHYLVTLLVCLLPVVPLVLYGDGLDPKALYRRFFAWFLTLMGLAVALTVYGGLQVLGVIEAPVWARVAYCLVLGAFWVGCLVRNTRELPGLFTGQPPAKPKPEPVDAL